jgi:hypothetical protein
MDSIEVIGRKGSDSDYTVHMYISKENTSARIRKVKRQAKW